MREIRDEEREQAQRDAAEAHQQHEERIAALGGVLARCNRDPYDWGVAWGPRGEFQAAEFTPPIARHSPELALAIASSAQPVWGWVILTAIPLVAAFSLGTALYKVLAIVVTVMLTLWAHSALRARRRLAANYLRDRAEGFAGDLELLRATNAREQEKLREEWDDIERQRARVRSAEVRGDTAALTAVLETELANEDFPVPVVFELEMPTVREARIELALPEIADVPEDRTQLTRTGKLSVKRMAQRDRTALYTGLCTGVVLRLVYETFRVLPMVETVEIFGTATRADPSTGHDVEFVALHLHTDRSTLARMNLPAADPSSALAALGGEFSHDRLGTLQPSEGNLGLRNE